MFRALAVVFRVVVSLTTAIVRAVFAFAQVLVELFSPAKLANPWARDFSIAVVRPDDLLALTFQFQNLSLIEEGTANARLARTNPSAKALIIVHFPPQSIVEEASNESNESSPVPELPIGARISGESRLVFRVPDGIHEIPFSLDALLDWSRYEPYLAPAALPLPNGPVIEQPHRRFTRDTGVRSAGGFFLRIFAYFFKPRTVKLVPKIEPPDEFTALEIPYRLFLSPNKFNAWAHARSAIEHGGRTELWHTRLGVIGVDAHPESPGSNEVNESGHYYRTLRAIWSPDYPSPESDPFAEMTLTADDRRQLVALTADFDRTGCEERVINAEALMLTSLGAWMNVRYAFDHPDQLHEPDASPDLDLVEWRHRMTFGRDHYVRVVKQGYLFPFGHRAVLITISERKFLPTPDGSTAAAYIRKRRFIVVQQPEKSFGKSGLFTPLGQSYDLMMPFKSVRITTLVTPNLAFGLDGRGGTIERGTVFDPQGAVVSSSDPLAFWIQTKSGAGALDDFLFHLIGTDEAGQASEFSAPLIFVAGTFAFKETQAETIQAAFMHADNYSRRRYDLSGQNVAFAPAASKGDTTFETHTIEIGAEVPSDSAKSFDDLISEGQPRFYPAVVRSDIGIPVAQKLLGTDQLVTIKFSDVFLTNGFNGNNAGQVFAELASASSLSFPADKSGGVANPSFNINWLSRSMGPIGGTIEGAVNQIFNPTDFFAGTLDAKILGTFSLADILVENVIGADKFPKLLSEQLPGQIKATLDWQTTELQTFGPFVADGAMLSLHTESVTHLPGSATPASPSLHVEGRLTNFQFNLFGLIVVPFKEFAFVAETGKKLDVTADLGGVSFGGPLAFINTLAALIPADGFKDPPGLDVSPTGISVNYSLALPAIGGGAFSIQHVKFSAGLNLPFIIEPVRLRFAFSERHDPFMVSIYGVTGGGFVGLALGLDGVEQLEASFEVGGSLAINLGVASGAVFIMLGVHFKWEKISDKQQQVLLGGYIRAGGAVEVLGLVTVSIEFYMELAYIFPGPENGTVHGEASVTVEVEVAFFSKSVSFSVQKDLPAPA